MQLEKVSNDTTLAGLVLHMLALRRAGVAVALGGVGNGDVAIEADKL